MFCLVFFWFVLFCFACLFIFLGQKTVVFGFGRVGSRETEQGGYLNPKQKHFKKLFTKQPTNNTRQPAPSKGCLLVVFKYSKASKKHPLEGLGI